MPILIDCPNGHPLRLKDKMAGKTGVCPKCGVEFTAPPAPSESPPLPDSSVPTADTTAVEWSAATAAGERLGPTVPTLFARWITEGRVTADSLVWRTGWPEWRRAGEVPEELPISLPTPSGGVSSEAIPAEAAPEVPSFAVPVSNAPRGMSYTNRKRQQARRRRNFTLALAVACLLLAAMLVVMIVW